MSEHGSADDNFSARVPLSFGLLLARIEGRELMFDLAFPSNQRFPASRGFGRARITTRMVG